MTRPPDLDPAALDRLLEWGGAVLLRQMHALFAESSGGHLAQIEHGVSAAPDADLREVHHAAHSLKSSAANLGAEHVRALAAGLEEAAIRGDGARCQALAGELPAALARAHAAIGRYLDDLV